MKTAFPSSLRGLLAVASGLAITMTATAPAQARSAPVLSWTPATSTATFDYGSVDVGTDSTQTFTLRNSGRAGTSALQITLTGSDAYTITRNACSGTSLGPEKACTVTVQYAPTTAGQTDTATLTAISNKTAARASHTLTGSARSTNRTPITMSDTNTIDEDASPNTVSGNVLTNDSDPDGNALSVTNAGTATLTYGSLTIHADGSYSYTLDNTNPVVNALEDGQRLTETFTQTVSDGRGGTASAQLSITINGRSDNRPPVAEDDTNTINEDASPNTVSGNVLTNDSDPDGNALSVTNAGTATLTYGSLTIHADGSYSYTLDNTNPVVNALEDGQRLTETFTQTVSDGRGGTASAQLSITINGRSDNRPPVAEDDTNTINEDASPNTVSGNVLTNDSDPDGNALSVTNAGTATLTYGSLTIHADGSYSYTLDNTNPVVNALEDGQRLTETFTQTVSDGRGGTASAQLSITINGRSDNRPPVAEDDTNTINEDASPNTVSGNVLTNDSDPDGNALSVTNAGTATLTYGSLTIHADGSYSYTLDNTNPVVNALEDGQRLTETFTQTVSDGRGGTASAQLSITINGTSE